MNTALIRPEGEFTVGATQAPFVVAQHFHEASKVLQSMRVKITTLGAWFKRIFLEMTEPAHEAMKISYARLTQDASLNEIIAALGGEDHLAMPIETVFRLLEKQGKGQQEGVLLADQETNKFFVKDGKGTLRTIDCYWTGYRWKVLVFVMERGDLVFGDRRLFYRSSEVKA